MPGLCPRLPRKYAAAASSAFADSSGRPASPYRSAALSSPAVSCSSRPRQYSAFACRCGISDPSARAAAWPVRSRAVPRSPVWVASRTASGSRSSISSSSSALSANPAVSTASASAGAPACSRSRLRASTSVPITWVPIRSACGAAAARLRRAAATSPRWNRITAAMPRSQQAAMGSFRSSGRASTSAIASAQRPVSNSSSPRAAVRLNPADHRAGLVGEVQRLPGRADGLLVPVQVAQGDGLVDLQQHPQVGQGRVGLGHGQRPLEQRQRVGHLPLHPGHDRQHVQRPAHRPVVARLRGHLQRGGGDLAGFLRIAPVAVRACREHQQPRAVPVGDSRRIQGTLQRGQRLRELADPHPALRQRPVQVDEQIGLDRMGQRPAGHLFGLRRVADPVEGVREAAHQEVMVRRASGRTRDCPPEEFRRHLGGLADQQIRGAGQPAQHPFVHRVDRAAGPAQRAEQLPGDPVWRGTGLGERTPRIAVPGRAHRHRHLLIQRRADQRMPESQAVAEFGEHAGRARLVHGGDQVRHATAQHDREVGHGEVDPEQGRRPQHLAHRAGDEAEPVRDGRRQGARRRTVRQHGGSRAGHGHARTAGQCADQLDDIQRIARRPIGEAPQVVIRLAADQRGDQLGDRRLIKPARAAAAGHHPPPGAAPAGRPAAAPGASSRPAAAAPAAPFSPAAPTG